jgi:hypothetical protein
VYILLWGQECEAVHTAGDFYRLKVKAGGGRGSVVEHAKTAPTAGMISRFSPTSAGLSS